jgi:hypothetical protein
MDHECLELAHRRGDRVGETMAKGHLLYDLFMLGEWDEMEQLLKELESVGADRSAIDRLAVGPLLLVNRGDVVGARRILDECASLGTTEEVQMRVGYLISTATVLCAERRPDEALALIQEALAPENRLSARHVFRKRALVEGVEAALDAGDLNAVDELLGEWERMRPVDRTPLLEAHRQRFTARLAARHGETDSVEPALIRSEEIFRELGTPFYVAVALLEHVEWLAGENRPEEAEPLLAEARETFERLQAKPWLERAAKTSLAGREPEAVTGRS